MSLTSDDVKRVAKLARLGLTDVETTETLAQLNSILELVDQMQQIDTDGVAPLAHPLELRQILRADAVAETNQRDKFQAIAPQADAGLYLVPRVIE
ncbi:Asp-tRNA(Asn)/Glu-tRNA(Gln) amidotransferase subunit GatC [Litorivicinus sp.]|nr:Asp-tRNA(Asn)/Glu-tRNA(Gln) amidotransferase subunit GatC [Litorivicinus sp.]MEC8694251.1 Asp-tRNA(Asn)/Glu-tRNA(Gln) amidotransferase subunit GatC [Pseudomonadota bacterium]